MTRRFLPAVRDRWRPAYANPPPASGSAESHLPIERDLQTPRTGSRYPHKNKKPLPKSREGSKLANVMSKYSHFSFYPGCLWIAAPPPPARRKVDMGRTELHCRESNISGGWSCVKRKNEWRILNPYFLGQNGIGPAGRENIKPG